MDSLLVCYCFQLVSLWISIFRTVAYGLLLIDSSLLYLYAGAMQRKVASDKQRPNLGADHDESAERLLMKRKMAARRKAELKRFNIKLMKELMGDSDGL